MHFKLIRFDSIGDASTSNNFISYSNSYFGPPDYIELLILYCTAKTLRTITNHKFGSCVLLTDRHLMSLKSSACFDLSFLSYLFYSLL